MEEAKAELENIIRYTLKEEAKVDGPYRIAYDTYGCEEAERGVMCGKHGERQVESGIWGLDEYTGR